MYLRNNINYQIRDDLCDDQLECVVIEIIRPHSRPFFVSTWYRSPNSPQDIFRQFESLVDKVDSEQKDFYLLGDLNCNMYDGSNNHNSSTLTNILDIYGLSQLISEPTRITPTSRTLIDLCITSSPEKISNSGVVHLGISDHSLVFMTLKICELAFIARLRHAFLKISTTTTSSTMLRNSHGIEFFQRQIQKRCGMFGKIYLWM